jgi:hypothetical protein
LNSPAADATFPREAEACAHRHSSVIALDDESLRLSYLTNDSLFSRRALYINQSIRGSLTDGQYTFDPDLFASPAYKRMIKLQPTAQSTNADAVLTARDIYADLEEGWFQTDVEGVDRDDNSDAESEATIEKAPDTQRDLESNEGLPATEHTGAKAGLGGEPELQHNGDLGPKQPASLRDSIAQWPLKNGVDLTPAQHPLTVDEVSTADDELPVKEDLSLTEQIKLKGELEESIGGFRHTGSWGQGIWDVLLKDTSLFRTPVDVARLLREIAWAYERKAYERHRQGDHSAAMGNFVTAGGFLAVGITFAERTGLSQEQMHLQVMVRSKHTCFCASHSRLVAQLCRSQQELY